MKIMVRLSYVVAIIGIALVCVLAEEKYTDQYDDVDVDAILANEKLRMQYYNCFMDTGPCVTADAKFFKEIFSEAFQSKCKKCTDKQKIIMDKVVVWYTENQPEQWKAMIAKTVEDVKAKNAGQ